jgi:DNA-binding beta-propeller fold protein YncE
MRLQALAADRELGRIWIPAGETGRVDVVDAASGAVTAIEGFPASPAPLPGQEARVGPSAVALGGGTAWIGNRGDGTICAFDARALRGRSCLKLPEAGLASSPAGLAWVAPTRELWVTLGAPAVGYRPADRSVAVLDAADPAALRLLARVEVGGAAEGHAVDAWRGLFYTNLEDRNRTLAIDVRTRRVAATWDAGCGPEGPRGLAVDVSRNFLFVACADRVVALDAGRGGAVLGTAETGGGLDDIDYLEPRRLLFAASARTATLSVIRVGEDGALATVATGDTPPLARAVAADAEGRAWVADPAGGRILRFEAAAGAPELTSPASSAPSGGSTRRSGSGSDRW